MDFFANGKYLGSAPAPAYRPNTICRLNIAYFCPSCGEVWGRILVDPAQRFHLLNHGCARCGPRWEGDEAGCLTSPSVEWMMPQIELQPDTPFDVLLNDFLQLEKLHDRTSND